MTPFVGSVSWLQGKQHTINTPNLALLLMQPLSINSAKYNFEMLCRTHPVYATRWEVFPVWKV